MGQRWAAPTAFSRALYPEFASWDVGRNTGKNVAVVASDRPCLPPPMTLLGSSTLNRLSSRGESLKRDCKNSPRQS